MTTYIIFEHIHDPRRDKPVEVHDDFGEAESAQLVLQQDTADIYNEARATAFLAGCAFSAQKTAADYNNHFRIEEVK